MISFSYYCMFFPKPMCFLCAVTVILDLKRQKLGMQLHGAACPFCYNEYKYCSLFSYMHYPVENIYQFTTQPDPQQMQNLLSFHVCTKPYCPDIFRKLFGLLLCLFHVYTPASLSCVLH